MTRTSRVKLFIDIAASLAMLTAAAVIIILNVSSSSRAAPPSFPVPSEPVSITGAALKGNERAKVVLIEFADFQCPYCATFAREVLPRIETAYVSTGRVAVAFMHLPLSKHQHAMPAALAAECAHREGRFWQMHDRLFLNRDGLSTANIRAAADAVGLEGVRYEECVADTDVRERLSARIDVSKSLGIDSTPSFFIGTFEPDRRIRVISTLNGAHSFDTFKDAIDAALEKPVS